MAYSTESDILKRIRKREYDKLVESVTGEATSAAILAEAIATADEIIDSYLRSAVVTVPLTTVPAMIRDCSADIAIFSLHKRIQYTDIPELWKDIYDTHIAWLRDVSKGRANLPTAPAEDEQQDSIVVTQETGVFNRNVY